MAMNAAFFAPDGDLYDMVSRRLAALPRAYQLAGHRVYHAIMDLLARGQIELGEEVTDRYLQEKSPWLCGYSRSFIQKGLRALQYIAGLIVRIRQHGRRVIRLIMRLRGRGLAPPQTPPSDKDNMTTTEGRSSSCPESSLTTPPQTSQKTPADPAIAALISRACRLVPTATPGKVTAAVNEFGAEWVGRALDRVEERNRQPGKLPVKSWGFVLTTLENYRREGGPAPSKPQVIPQPATTKTPEAPVVPPKLLSAKQVAELIEQARSRQRTIARLAVTTLRLALREGAISPELAGTIPSGLVDSPAGLEVPAAGSEA
jgi:hypothetical protein